MKSFLLEDEIFLLADEIFGGFQPADTDGLESEWHGGEESVKWGEIILSGEKVRRRQRLVVGKKVSVTQIRLQMLEDAWAN